MISPINFTGIKNIGYAKVYKDTPVQKNSRVVMNMELTDDDNNKDLSEYRKFLTKHQGLKNEINDTEITIYQDKDTDSLKVQEQEKNTIADRNFAFVNGKLLETSFNYYHLQ